MVTCSTSFSARTNQATLVKTKESSGMASKKAGWKKHKLIRMEPMIVTPMEVGDDIIPSHLHSSINSESASSPFPTTLDSSLVDLQPMQQSAPSTPKQACAMMMASQVTPTWNNCSPAFCPLCVYFNMKVTPKSPAIANLSAQQWVDAYHDNLMDLLEALYKIDNMITLWPFTELTAPELELLTNPTSLGALITQLMKYFQGLHICNEFPLSTFPFYLDSWWNMTNSWNISTWCLPTIRCISISDHCRHNKSLAWGDY